MSEARIDVLERTLAADHPHRCQCGHLHASSTDGEDAGCACSDAHDWQPRRLNKPMTKAELIRHLETNHSQAVRVELVPQRWTKQELAETHRIIHLGLGR